MIRIIGFLLIVLCFLSKLSAQQPDNIRLAIEVVDGAKEEYVVGDVVSCMITATQTGKYCTEGVKKVKLFVKGLNITKKEDWKQLSQTVSQRIVHVQVIANNSGKVKLTAYRKTDKGVIVETLNFKMGN